MLLNCNTYIVPVFCLSDQTTRHPFHSNNRVVYCRPIKTTQQQAANSQQIHQYTYINSNVRKKCKHIIVLCACESANVFVFIWYRFCFLYSEEVSATIYALLLHGTRRGNLKRIPSTNTILLALNT